MDGEWKFWHSWDAMVQSASLGAIGYTFITATMEVAIVLGIMGVDYVKNSRKKTRQDLISELLANAKTDEEREIIRRLCKERGIELPLIPA
jgi:hypothetical protein